MPVAPPQPWAINSTFLFLASVPRLGVQNPPYPFQVRDRESALACPIPFYGRDLARSLPAPNKIGTHLEFFRYIACAQLFDSFNVSFAQIARIQSYLKSGGSFKLDIKLV